MYLNLFICSYHRWGYLISFASIKCCLQLGIRQFVKQMVTKLKCGYCSRRATWIHISDSASVSNMWFQQEVWLTISYTGTYSLRIICKINSSVFNSLEGSGWVMHFIEHSIFPACTWWLAEGTWRFSCFKLIPIMGIFNKELHMAVYVHMYNNWSIINNVMV